MISKASDKVYLTPTIRLSVRTLLKPSKSLSKIAAAFGKEGSFPHTRTAYTSDPPASDKDKSCVNLSTTPCTSHM